MKLELYQVDAFTDKIFSGNPAAVCIPEQELSDQTMLQIAAENNLSETAFVLCNESGFNIRWCTPTVEVALCGHATLASAHVLFSHKPNLLIDNDAIIFKTRQRGDLKITRSGDQYMMDFPADQINKVVAPDTLVQAIGKTPSETFKGQTDYLMVYDSEDVINAIQPDFRLLYQVGVRGVCVTAPGNKHDFVSRFFAPGSGIDEDPVTGSAHTTLTPYWANRLAKNVLSARQISKRGGDVECQLKGNRVLLSGTARTYLKGFIEVPS